MKSYSEVIDRLGNQLFGLYMNGHNDLRPTGTGLISFIYDVPETQVYSQVSKQFEKRKEEYYAKVKAKKAK